MKLFWTETAKQDLLSIKRHIAMDNPAAAQRWIKTLRNRARKALDAPLAYREEPEFLRNDIRELIEENYRIVYEVFLDKLVILTVFEGYRLFPVEKIQDL